MATSPKTSERKATPAGPKKKLPVERIVSRPYAPTAPPPSTPAFTPSLASAPPTARPPAAIAISAAAWIGIAFLGLTLIGFILALTLPWISLPDPVANDDGAFEFLGFANFDETEQDLKWSNLHEGLAYISTYYDFMVDAPLTLYALGFLAGGGLVVAEFAIKGTEGRHWARLALSASLALLGFLLTLVGTRWFGVYISELMTDGDATHLHVVPYVHLAVGLAGFGGGLYLLRREIRAQPVAASHAPRAATLVPLVMLATAAATLLFSPLIPLGSVDVGDNTIYFTEGMLHLVALRYLAFESFRDPVGDLEIVNLATWSILLVSAAALAVPYLARASQRPDLGMRLSRGCLLSGIPVVLGTVFVVLLYVNIPAMGTDEEITSRNEVDAGLAFNYLPALAYAAFLGLYAWYVVAAIPAPTRRGQESAPQATVSGPGRI